MKLLACQAVSPGCSCTFLPILASVAGSAAVAPFAAGEVAEDIVVECWVALCLVMMAPCDWSELIIQVLQACQMEDFLGSAELVQVQAKQLWVEPPQIPVSPL